MSKKKKKRHLKITGLLFIILLLYLVGMILYTVFMMPIKNIIVKGNNLVSENEIIEILNINESTPYFKIRKSSLKKKIRTIPLINTVNIKRSFSGKITINVTENKILYLNYLDNKFVLSNGKEMAINKNFVGYPTLVNYIPSDIYKKFIKKFSKVDIDIIKMISEIEYSTSEFEGVVIDNERFLLRMNDGNKIYINTANIEKLNNYQIILSSINDTGTLYLDSNSDNYIFNTKEEEKKEEVEKNEDELQ